MLALSIRGCASAGVVTLLAPLSGMNQNDIYALSHLTILFVLLEQGRCPPGTGSMYGDAGMIGNALPRQNITSSDSKTNSDRALIVEKVIARTKHHT